MKKNFKDVKGEFSNDSNDMQCGQKWQNDFFLEFIFREFYKNEW
jgi:hypothetical protein